MEREESCTSQFMETNFSEWHTHGDRLMSRRSSTRTPNGSFVDSSEATLNPQQIGRQSTSNDMNFENIEVANQEGIPKNFEPSMSDSSEDESVQSDKNLSAFSGSVIGVHDESENDSSEFGEYDVSEEARALFQYIDHYKPKEVEMPIVFKPFIPEYIPIVGSVDKFIKVPRPDGEKDYLGLKVLDESGPKQSDPSIVSMQLRAASMESSSQPLEVSVIENPEENRKKIDAWIDSMKDIQRSKLPLSVTYSKPMPDITKLLQEPTYKLEKDLMEKIIPAINMDLNFDNFVDTCCSAFGIPVYESRVEALHCMFTLFLELRKASQVTDVSISEAFGMLEL